MRLSSRQSTFAGLALVALFVVGQASTVAHRLLVQHVSCPEHGESIHVDQREPPELIRVGLGRELRDSRTAAMDHGHEHCLVSLSRRESVAEAVSGRLALPGAGPTCVRFDHSCESGSGLALLLLAPKSSPPA